MRKAAAAASSTATKEDAEQDLKAAMASNDLKKIQCAIQQHASCWGIESGGIEKIHNQIP